MKILGWLLAIFFGLSSAGLFMENAWKAGVLALCAAIFSIPFIWTFSNYMREKEGKGGPFAPKTYLLVSIVIYAIAIVISPSFEQSESTSITETPSSNQDQSPETSVVTMNLTAEEIAQRFNSFIVNTGFSADHKIKQFKYADGPVNDTASYVWKSAPIALTVAIDKHSKNAKYIMINFQSDGTQQSAQTGIIIIGGLITATNPDVTSQEAGKLILPLLKKAADNPDESAEQISKGFKYSANSSAGVGLMFGIEPVE